MSFKATSTMQSLSAALPQGRMLSGEVRGRGWLKNKCPRQEASYSPALGRGGGEGSSLTAAKNKPPGKRRDRLFPKGALTWEYPGVSAIPKL